MNKGFKLLQPLLMSCRLRGGEGARRQESGKIGCSDVQHRDTCKGWLGHGA